MNIVKIVLFLIICCCYNNANAEHVFGANISYEMISSDASTFTIELKVTYLVDCFSSNNQGFPIIVYNLNNNTETYTLNSAFFIDADNITVLDNIEYDCLAVPNNLCTRQIVATETRTFPISDQSYVFVHSSCCRNSANVNIIEPTENGLTIFEVITPFDQQSLNSSPQFEPITSLTICSNEFTEYELPIFDPDGDSLAVRLCLPEFQGQGNQNPPPYPPLTFVEAGGYTFDNPFGPTGTLEINEENQVIEILASLQGQYALAFCVEEYRDGVLLGETKLELQIVVLDCTNVQANANTAFTDDDGVEVFVVCNGNQLQTVNNSFPMDLITEFEWTIENENNTFSWPEWEPLINVPVAGDFTGTLVVNSIFDCPDTLHFRFQVNPTLEIGFEIDSLQCDGGAISFFDRTVSDVAVVDHLYIIEGDSFFISSPLVEFPQQGTYNIYYKVVDEFGCEDEMTTTYFFDPTTAQLSIEMPDDTTSCAGKFFTPVFNSEDFDSWIFEDQPWTAEILIPEARDVTIIAEKEGCFVSKTFFVEPIICESKLFMPNVFSPNDDGFNDVIGPVGDDFELINFVVFDRWGDQVFGTNSNNIFWDGKFKGEKVNSGIYPYSIEYRETILGKTLFETGTITLVR